MKKEIVKTDAQVIEKLVLDGDLSKMSQPQKVQYYNSFCQSLGLNPLTQPFQIIKFQGKERLYATKDCTEQLRKIHGVSITDISTTSVNDVFVVTAKAQDKHGKTDCSTGAVNIKGLGGDNLANALMKAETKAKRRVTLSICGLGILDESETDTLPGARTEPVKEEETTFEVVNDAVDNPDLEYLEQWAVEIGKCRDESDLVRLYNGNKPTVDADIRIKELFTKRKSEVRNGSLVK